MLQLIPLRNNTQIRELTNKLEQFKQYDTITVVMDNNNDSVKQATPENNGPNPYMASESIINPQSTTESNLSQSSGMPTITPTTTLQGLGTSTVTPTPLSQQQSLTPNATVVPVNVNPVSNTNMPIYNNLSPGAEKKPKMVTRLIKVMSSILILGLAIGGSYLFGRSHEKIVIKEPEIKPINLPPQAVVLNECAPGRGKQYILPKDIPVGPIYSVVNSKVIAIEYSLDLVKLLDGSDVFSDTILSLVNEYPTNHLSIIPDNPNPALLKRVQLIMFVVPKEEANKIACA